MSDRCRRSLLAWSSPSQSHDERQPEAQRQPEQQPPPQVFRARRGNPGYKRTLSRRYRRPHRGVRVDAAAAEDFLVRCDAALAAAPPGAALSGRTAATCTPCPCRAASPAARRPAPADGCLRRSHVDVAGIECRLCVLPPEHTRVYGGLLVTTPARTFLDLAAVLSLPDLVAVADVIVARHLATEDELRALVAWAGRRRGVRAARDALRLLDPRSKSPQESRLRVLLALASLPVPEPNAYIVDAAGGFVAEGDLVWREYKVLVEYDGAVHLDEAQRRKDAARRNQLVREGWILLVYTADVLGRWPGRIVADVQDALLARGWRPSRTAFSR